MIYEEFKHFSHKHNLKPECDNIPFICTGCDEPGLGQKFQCRRCNYDLHLHCALAPSTTFHSFYQDCEFTFLESAPRRHRCNACGRHVNGFAFGCKAYGYYLHPSCAKLPLTIKGNGRIKLYLMESKSVESKCRLCGNINSIAGPIGWSYRSACKKYHFHVSCVKNAATEKTHNEYFARIKIEKPDMGLAVIPSLQLTSQTSATPSWWRWKFRKYWKIAKVVLNMIITTVIGDPIGGMAALIQYLLSG